ncbi:MAG: HAD family hydrolase [Sulfurimonas sp. RIFOXYD12_FULL_33_39]|uniref:HAD-IIA family hydrolase n=1 Tax=unclassified Sulfurimonas TaxID=2623549 RepID=UPI0008C06032|nr:MULTISPECIES: HAD-IIA family hydrolase [unclassified Sulfurimonas]OHE03997.1 MAG: HAD family hydrolase [Sulfurimonas sp. RIFCSPLOWO2_12_FULL_34_6]OHE08794.1 MAG: HAD family hydrolase [Sulfurimonas sp. RIFOXYD12_FULL_33_39]OHE14079.1 MAG: HAD family hydrolase [Sulfurimonas sp. RIFOXYD2_FULL_34_21]DAB27624.1 MAG TPA: HAD family hydrolase [Sulfurimonas sp. UBA10385]
MYFIDVQGTLISDADKSPIRGSREFINMLNEKKIPYMIITNNTKHSSKDFYAYLKSIGFNLDFSHYLDPLMMLESHVEKDGVAAYGTPEFLELLANMGFELNYKNPKTVLVSIKDSFVNDEFAQMIDFILSGAKLVGMHETSIYAKNSKRYPGVGAILKMLEFATSCSYSVVGKPSVPFYEESLLMLRKEVPDANFNDITIISDDVKGDLGGAKELGMKTIFVTSGKYKSADEIVPSLKTELRPDYVYADMQEILEAL